ncbi:ATP-binding protein [Streptomyces sp. NPDC101062]|uniref:ATP-binding protein n=1 Tax=unclassified Streptomyces TaxID=2593676 RepID=UPI003822F3B9
MTICVHEPITAHDNNEPPTVPGSDVRVWKLDGRQAAPALARDLVRAVLGELSMAADIAEDIILATSEIVANAYEHGAGPWELRLSDTGETLVCEVVDSDVEHWPGLSDQEPADGDADEPRRPDDADLDALLADIGERGRGLGLVRRLCDRCGVHTTVLLTESPMVGKGVWFARDHDPLCGELPG